MYIIWTIDAYRLPKTWLHFIVKVNVLVCELIFIFWMRRYAVEQQRFLYKLHYKMPTMSYRAYCLIPSCSPKIIFVTAPSIVVEKYKINIRRHMCESNILTGRFRRWKCEVLSGIVASIIWCLFLFNTKICLGVPVSQKCEQLICFWLDCTKFVASYVNKVRPLQCTGQCHMRLTV